MDARSWNRHLVEKEVGCVIGGVRDVVFLYNLSSGGCMIELGDPRAELGESVAIELGTIETARGRIVWRAAGCAGVRFDVPVHDALVRHIGFNPPTIPFEEQLPRDRFGRALPPIDSGERRRAGI